MLIKTLQPEANTVRRYKRVYKHSKIKYTTSVSGEIKP